MSATKKFKCFKEESWADEKFKTLDEQEQFIKKIESESTLDMVPTREVRLDFDSDGCITYNGNKVSEVSSKSLLERAAISGEGLKCLPVETLVDVCNKCMANADKKKKTLVFTRQGTIAAMLSGEYVSMPTSLLLDGLKKQMEKLVSNNGVTDEEGRRVPAEQLYCCGMHNALFDTAVYRFYDSKIASAYNPGGKANAKIELYFITSNVGDAKSSVYCKIFSGSTPHWCGAPIEVYHRNGTSIAQFVNELDGLFIQIKDIAEQVAKLREIKLSHPVECLSRVADSLVLRKAPKEANVSAFEYAVKSGLPVDTSAFGVYDRCQKILSDSDLTQSELIKFADKVIRLTTWSPSQWKKYDLPTK